MEIFQGFGVVTSRIMHIAYIAITHCNIRMATAIGFQTNFESLAVTFQSCQIVRLGIVYSTYIIINYCNKVVVLAIDFQTNFE